MKKYLFTRILSLILAFAILFSDISAYAASDMSGEPAEEQIQAEDPPIEEIPEEVEEEQELEEEQVDFEESAEPEENQPIVIEDTLDDIYRMVPEVETSAIAMEFYGLTDGMVSLKDSNETAWIDRLDLTEVPEIEDFYEVLEEASDNDGAEDYLIENTYFKTDYNLKVHDITKTVEVQLSDPANEETVQSEVAAAVSEKGTDVFERYGSYIVAVRDAFDRDHPEVFWLSGASSIGCGFGYRYTSPQAEAETVTVEYTVSLFMVLKSTVNGEEFDVRATDYQDESAIKAGISFVDSACDQILTEASSFNDYEKIRYFNQILTSSNDYNTSSDFNAIGHDCRECISALDGRSGEDGPVCEGYARAMKVLCDKAGIPCVLVSGVAYNREDTDGEAHMWNNIRIDDNWYAVDVTWNDPMGGTASEDWLLVGSDTEILGMRFADSHCMENLVSMGGVAFVNGPQMSTEKYVVPKEDDVQENPTIDDSVNEEDSGETTHKGGIQVINGKHYLLDDYEKPVVGYSQYDGKKYYSDKNGVLQSGWIKIGTVWHYFDKNNGFAEVGYKTADRYLYTLENGEVSYFTNKTTLLKNSWQTHAGARYYFDENGFAVQGWYQDENYCYYAETKDTATEKSPVGNVVKGVKEIGEHTYYFDSSYHLATGWQKINNVWRFFEKKEDPLSCYEITYTSQKGWQILNEENARKIYVNASGSILKGWQTIDGQRYYFDSNGFVIKDWFQVGTYWYYADSNGIVAKGAKKIGENIYCFHPTSYYRLTGWQTVNGKRYYIEESGEALVNRWYQEGDYWYHAGDDGAMAKDLVTIDGKKYYFDSNYRLVTGWKRIGDTLYFFDSVSEQPEACYAKAETKEVGKWIGFEDGRKSYINAKYQALTGWQNIDGKRYYFDTNGIMQKGLFQVDRYYYYAQEAEGSTDNNPEGSIAAGIKKIDEKIYGFHPSSYYRLTGWQTINGSKYYFQDDCSAVIGWYQEGNHWYYADDDGKMVKGAVKIGDHTYYFDSNYRLATGWIKIDNVWRFFDKKENHLECYEIGRTLKDGWLILNEENPRKSYVNTSNSMLKGWQTISGQRYYFDSIGMMETEWFQVGNYWYYADSDGIVAKGIKTIGEDTYCFHASSYYRLTGWQTINGKRFYLDSEGKAKTGIFEVSGKTYYGEPCIDAENGIMKGQVVTGARRIDGKIYVFHPTSYYRLTGWQTVNGKRYYIEESGEALVNRWYQEGDYWYYAGTDGAMAQGRMLIGEQYYFFDSNYRLSTGWKRVGNIMYYYDSVAEQPQLCVELASVTNPNGWVLIGETKKSYINSKYQVLTGWQTISGQRYYFDAAGIALTGEFQVDRYHYYASESGADLGALAKNTRIIDGKVYGFHPTSYYRLTGWQTLENSRYYFRDDWTAATGWFREGTDWYYAAPDGKVQKDTVTIKVGEEEKIFCFDSNYRLKTGWVKIGNLWRFFQVSDNKEACYELTSEGVSSGWVTLIDGKKAYIHSKNGAFKGWQTIDGLRYYFDSTGIMQTGWFSDGTYWYYASEAGHVLKDVQTIDEKSYYFDGNYRLTTGWVKTGTEWRFFNNSDNYLERYELESTYENGWLTITSDGRKSYVNASNTLFKGWQNIGSYRYYFDTAGVLQTGWFQVGSYWYYGEEKVVEGTQKVPEGAVAKGAKEIGGKIYGFHPTSYYRLSGWQTLDSKRYFFDENYQAVIGWYQEGDYWYYADSNGHMAKDVTVIGDKKYYFDSNYRLGTGWKRVGNTMYFFEQLSENPVNCHAVVETDTVGRWMTFTDGRKSYINARYQVLTGWQTIDGNRYYFDSMGIMVTGEFQIGRYYYYAQEAAAENCPKGSIASGAKEIDGKIYGFHTTQYYRLSGWQTLNGKRYFFKDDCSAVIGWHKDGNYTYYAGTDGAMVQGVKDISIPATEKEEAETTNTYYFDGNYRLTTGWIKLSNVWRFFNNSEKYVDCHEITYTKEDGWLTLNEENARKSYVNTFNSILKGWQTISGQRYYFDSVGMMVTGEFKVGNYYYYAEPATTIIDGKEVPQGALAKGMKVIDGNTYGFHPTSYYRLTGWQTLSGKRFFLNSDGKAQKGVFENGGRTYYAKTLSDTVNNGIVGEVLGGRCVIDGITYVFHPTSYYRLTGWQTVGGQRYYLKADGSAVVDSWYQEGDYWYHADSNGYMAKGRTRIDGKWYYFDTNYRLSTGWKREGNTMYFYDFVAERPELCYQVASVTNPNGWVEISATKRSYINSKYQVLTGWQTIDKQRYYFDSTGIVLTGEFQIGRYYYYGEPSGETMGALAVNAKTIDGKIYGFHPTSYYRLTGWQTLNGKKYYFQSDCSAVVGWYQEGNYWYYAQSDGSMFKGELKLSENSQSYYFDSNYRLITGWQTMDGARCYFDSRGILKTGWFTDGTYWYYADENGKAVKNQQTILGRTYYFDGNYRLKTGWVTLSGVRYHFNYDTNPENCYAIYSGTVTKGWFTFEGKTSYFNSSLNPVTGFQTIDGKRYYFDASGVMQTGWFKVGTYWYYANSKGTVVSGTLELKVGEEKKTYYFDENYRLQTGFQTIGGQRYFIEIFETPENYKITCIGKVGDGWQTMEGGKIFYADKNGNIKTGWQTIDKQRYYFDAAGILQIGWFTVSGKTYYAEERSDADVRIGTVAQGVKTIDEDTYVFHSSQYYMLTGFQSYGGKRYYLSADGKAKSGWFTIGTDLYYGAAQTAGGILKGTLASGAQQIDDDTYFFHPSSNYRVTGWQTSGGKRYYLNESGKAQTGWFTVSGKIYYGEPETVGETFKGTLAAGAKKISGNTYFFHTSSNYRLTGWQTANGQRYYLNLDGKAQTGWFQVSGYHHYADKNGIVLSGLQENIYHEGLGVNKTYYFDSNYRLKTGWQTVHGKHYFFENAENPEDCYKTNTANVINAGWFELQNGQWCYADANGNIKTGWQTIDKQKYYFDANGVLQTGWFKVGNNQYYADPVVAKGITVIDGKTYCFHTGSSYMLSGWQTMDGKRFYLEADQNGRAAAKTGWFTVSGKTYYADQAGTVAKGAVTIGSDTYVFHSSQYYMLTGFQSYGGKRYYLLADGKAKTGWFTIGTDVYYGEPAAAESVLKGTLASGAKEIGGKTYFFHTSSNYRLTGWQSMSGKRYYLDDQGIAKTGWFTVSGKIYYGEPATTETILKGTLASGAKVLDGKVYVFHSSSNYRLTGWQTAGGKRYYLQSDGSAKTGWFTVSGKTYYADPAVASGIKAIDGKTYCFHTNQSYMLSGWQTVNGQRFYLEADQNGRAAAKTDWFTLSGKTYYADHTGTVAKGAVTIGNDTYVFHSSQYYMLTGFQSYGGKRYYLQKDGTAQTGWFRVGTDLYYGEPVAVDTLLKGTLAAGAKEIGSATYFFHTTSNYRLTGWQTVNGQRYYLNSDGTAKTGWFTISGKIYYAEPATQNGVLMGTLAKGAKEIGGKTYVFHTSSYYRLTGWQTVNKLRYYLNSDGKAKTGWFTISGKTYYADPVVASGMKKVGEETYYFHTSQYYKLTGWQTISGQRYYFDANGVMETGWFEVGGYFYYANPDGKVAKGLVTLPYEETGVTKKYYFDNNYRLKTGWQVLNSRKYFFENAANPWDCYATVETYEIETGWITLENGQICYANSKGTILTGWQTIDKERYYFDANGVLQTGWFKVGNNLYYADPAVAKGIKVIDGKTYVFHTGSYYMLSGWQTISGKRFYLEKDANGRAAAKTGWFTLSGKTYYADETGDAAKGAKEIGGKTYVFHSSQYYMLTGFQSYGGKRYYLQANGTAKTGWFTVGTDLYYGEPESSTEILKGALASGAKEIGNETYFFHTSSNYRLTGWQTAGGQRYYLDRDGKAKTGWFTISGKIYYGEPATQNGVLKGTLAKGAKNIGGKTYVFHSSSYYRLTGWQTVNSQRYYLNSDGVAKTGWFTLSGKTYYAEPATGIVLRGKCLVGTETYDFHTSSYYMLTGWQTISGQRYYFAADGKMETGWFKVDGYDYYANADGTIVKGLQELPYGTSGDKKQYYFDNNYRLKTGWYTINSKKYFFTSAEQPENCFATYEGSVSYGWMTMENGQICYANSKGTILTGWQTISGRRYYFDANGVLQIGWFKIGNNQYYGETKVESGKEQEIPVGAAAQGIKVIDDETYVFHTSNYYMLTGFQTYNGQKYYFQADGKAKAGWFKSGGYWYYGSEVSEENILKGAMTTGIRKINVSEGEDIVERSYYFDANYRLSTGWKVIGGIKYFFHTDENPQNCCMLYSGTVSAGWLELPNGDKSYINGQGNAVTGWQTIDGNKYYFDSNGIMQIGCQIIGGVEYFFDSEGIYIPMTTPTLESVTSTFYQTADVKWKQMSGVKSYTLEYSKNSAFPSGETCVVEISAAETKEYRAEALDPGATYYFRLKYVILDDESAVVYDSPYSPVKSVSVRAEIEATANSAVISDCYIVSGTRNTGVTVQINATLKDRIRSADDKYYIVETESYGNGIDLKTPVGSVDKDFEIDTTVLIDAGDGSDDVRECVNIALMNKFALAILKENGTYQVISAPMGITNPEFVSENTRSLFKAKSKKGIQGVLYAEEGKEILRAEYGKTKHTLFNVFIQDCISNSAKDGFVSYQYKGKNYYFSDFSDLIGNVKSLNAGYGEGDARTRVAVTFCLLLEYTSSKSYLLDPAARTKGYHYYTLNIREEQGRETYEALFHYMGEVFGQKNCYVTNWILGNEVNSSRAWNYHGNMSQDTYMQCYATAFRLLYNGVKAAKTGNNVYISLDNGWTAAPDTYSGKSTLDKFAAYAQKENEEMLWSIAWHGYSYPLTRCDFWNDNTYTTSSTSTRYISMKNISVLTDYAASLETKYNKPTGSIRVILSEQGYNAGQGSKNQATALAWGYYMAEFNDRIDAFIIRAIADDPAETQGGLYLGIHNMSQQKRSAYYVYEYMDSDIDAFCAMKPYEVASDSANHPKVLEAQEILGSSAWNSRVPGYDKAKLAAMR